MMMKKIRRLIVENRLLHKKNNRLLRELDWSNVYHDSIRGKIWLEGLPLNIGRWAGSYSFFYILNRILNDFKPNKILELGLGESSKFISAYMDNYLLESKHLIIEQDNAWKDIFENSFKLSLKSKIKICPLEIKQIHGHQVKSYGNFDKVILNKFDLYIIDGPHGSENFSRFEIVRLMEVAKENDEFVIVFDDYQRKGEQQTINVLLELFKSKNIKIYQNSYFGNKTVHVIGTEKYKYIQTL